MAREYEQPLKSPEQEETREIVRQYIPIREYYGEVNGLQYGASAEVAQIGNDLVVSSIDYSAIWFYDDNGDDHDFPLFALHSRLADSLDTWRVRIERDICERATLLPCTVWKVEYEE